MKCRDRATLKLLLGQCCCPDELPPPPQRPQRPAVHGRPMTPRAADVEEPVPFVAAPPSFDSPQRAGRGHLPDVDASGAFEASGGLPAPGTLTLDSGQTALLPDHLADHDARQVRWVLPQPTRDDTPPDAAAYGVPSHYADISDTSDPRLAPVNQSREPAGVQRSTWTVRTLTFAGAVVDTQVVTTAPYEIALGQVQISGNVVTDYRRQVRWAYLSGSGERAVWRRIERVIAVHSLGHDYLPEAPDYPRYDVLHETAADRTTAEWRVLGEEPGPDQPNDPVSGWPIYATLNRGPRMAYLRPGTAPPRPDLGPVRWRAGPVTVSGSPGTDHALLREGDVLGAHGITVTGPGSWAALCGPVTETGPEVWVLAETGGDVTLIRPDGSRTLSRAAFEREILRAPADSFLRFHAEGLLTHTFPPHWALADCGAAGGARAVTLHDPWRDSVTGKPPEGSTDPLWWWWPRRPRRRPVTLPPDAPVAPLRLALADVWQSADPDPGGGGSS